jgi:hypothetical protein
LQINVMNVAVSSAHFVVCVGRFDWLYFYRKWVLGV